MRKDLYQERMLKVVNHIQRHLDQPLHLPDLAALACVSPYHFHRLFKGMVDEGVAEHVRRLRRERAAQQLCHSDRSFTESAADAGFESFKGFGRAFRSHFGHPPSPIGVRAPRRSCRYVPVLTTIRTA
jgi:AraC family transcriptional regulator